MAITRFAGSMGLIYALVGQPALAQRQPVAPLAPRSVVAPGIASQPATQGRIVSYQGADHAAAAGLHALILVNSSILVGQQELQRIKPRDIVEVRVYKSAGELPGWPIFTPAISGIIDVKLWKGISVPAKPLSALRHRLHVVGPVRYEQYGQPLPEAQLRVAATTMKGATTRVDVSGSTVIVLSDDRPILPGAASAPGQPPRILIRGTASR